MGQGYSITTLSAGAANIDVPELSDLNYEKSLGNARFMKTVRARSKNGLVVAKVVMKPYPSLKLDEYIKVILHERNVLADIPNALPYHRAIETSSNGYLLRQYLYSSLYDRMSTRPFLEDIEKRWLSFQLLCAVRDCHARNIHHGDIKTENTLVTSWNWLYLSDFSSSFKPTYLPEDNPANFSFYFDTSGRRTCYIAPERFLSAGQHVQSGARVNWAMDIFSVGCVIAELFLETPVFSLAQLFRYRRREYDPDSGFLKKIADKDVRELVAHMIQLEPESRFSADEYLNFWRRRTFPEYFFSFLHQYMYLITDSNSGQSPGLDNVNLVESDDRIDRIYNDFDKISFFLGYDKVKNFLKDSLPKYQKSMFPLHIDIPHNLHLVSWSNSDSYDGGSLIFLVVVVSSLRSTARATARQRACELLLAFAERVTDEAKLDRIIPYLTVLLSDKSDIVRVAALRAVTQVLALVKVVSPINAYIFPEYILPRLLPFVSSNTNKPSLLLRTTYAYCIATLAETASRYLNIMQALRADGTFPTSDPETEGGRISQSAYQTLFDAARDDLMMQFETHVKGLLTDTDTAVKRAFLTSVSSLCVFFGSAKAYDVILSHLNTYLNDRDWMLKCAFFETIVGVATYVGGASLEEYILPLMVQALADPEEFVVERVIRSFSSMARLGLFQRSKIWELIQTLSRFTMHPNLWIREAAVDFISSSTVYLNLADIHCIIIPLIQPYLKFKPSDLSELRIMDCLEKPLPRLVMEVALIWALKAEKGSFWLAAQKQRNLFSGAINTSDLNNIRKIKNIQSPANEIRQGEDKQWMERLQNAGMSPGDESKLLSLKEYLWLVAQHSRKGDEHSPPSRFNQIIALTDLGIPPQTVFFDHDQSLIAERQEKNRGNSITAALLEASTRRLDDADDTGKPTDKDKPISNADDGNQEPTGFLQDGKPGKKNAIDIPAIKGDISDNSDLPSSLGSVREGKSHLRTVQYKGSALNLLTRKDMGNKASPEIGTSAANAFGEVDGPNARENLPKQDGQPKSPAKQQKQISIQPASIKYRGAHTYIGHDPYVLKLLDTLYLENYPGDLVDFGPLVNPISRRQPIKYASGQSTPFPWRPEGTLVAVLGEHTSSINRILTAPNHAFFISSSNDGSIKVWDSSRLERNVSYRSRMTHKHAPGTRISSLTFVENTHCFVSSATDGSINVVKVDYTESNGLARYGKPRVLRQHSLPDGEYVVCSEHFRADSQSILMIVTNKSRIIGIDLRTMTMRYEMQNSLEHGIPSCFCLDRKKHSLILGTTHGFLDLWDLRFQLRLRSWRFSGGSPIHRITLYPARKSRKYKVCVAGGTGQGEVTVWDLERSSCLEIYRTSTVQEGSTGHELWDADEVKSTALLPQFISSPEDSAGLADGGVRTISVGAQVAEIGGDLRSTFFLSAGPDWKVRYWDMSVPEASTVVSGMQPDEQWPTYEKKQSGPETTVVSERVSTATTGTFNAQGGASTGAQKVTAPNSSAKRDGRRDAKSRNASTQQQHLLKGHLDMITDVALLEYPYGMVISADRSGVIYVFQ